MARQAKASRKRPAKKPARKAGKQAAKKRTRKPTRRIAAGRAESGVSPPIALTPFAGAGDTPPPQAVPDCQARWRDGDKDVTPKSDDELGRLVRTTAKRHRAFVFEDANRVLWFRELRGQG